MTSSNPGIVLHDPVTYTQSKGAATVAISVTFAVISSIVMGLRLYTRCAILKTAGLDDWTMLVAQVMAIVVSVATCFEVKNGLGRHAWAVSPEQTAEQLKLLYTNIIIYNLAMNIIKISFLFQYRRIFQSDLVRRICKWTIAYVIVWAAVQDIILGLTCVPISFIVPSTAKWCLNTLPIWYFSSALSIGSDVAIFMIPLPSVLKLQLPRRQKFLVFGIFCLGFFVCIISVIRIFSLHDAVITQDPSWDNTEAAAWSVIELNCGILCSSLPTLRPLLAKLIPGLGSRYRTNAAYQHYGSDRTGPRRMTSDPKLNGSPLTISTDELVLGPVDLKSYNRPGVYASCSAGGWAKETNVEMGLPHAHTHAPVHGLGIEGTNRVSNQIVVTTETRTLVKKKVGGAPLAAVGARR